MFPAPAAPWDVGRVLSWDGRPWSCFGYPKQHHIKLQSFLSAFQILLGTAVRRWRRFFLWSLPNHISGCCLWGCVWGGHICGRGWHWQWDLHGLVASPCAVLTERSPRAQGCSKTADRSFFRGWCFPPQPWQCWEPQQPPAAPLGWVRSWWPWARGGGTVWGLAEGGHPPGPQGRGKEIVLSYETFTETSLLSDFFII